VPALRSFLGLASYYRKFIKNFAKIAVPLTNLLKKFVIIYEREEVCNEAFETLKGILVKTLVLKLPDFDKDFEIHSDASDFAIGRVLVQEGRPVAFESKKLSETKRRWPTHEKEMWAWSQNLGPLLRLQRCGGVDQQCDLEVFCHLTQVVFKAIEMVRHIGLVQCRYSTQPREG
jgi:hypothetical protein